MYIQFVCYLDFQKLKKDLENIFSSCHNVNFRKKLILAIFRIIFQKIDIISDVIIAIAAILNFLFYQIFCNITKYDCSKFHVKSIFLSGFMQRGRGRGGHYVPPSSRGMIRQKYPGANRVNSKICFIKLGFRLLIVL